MQGVPAMNNGLSQPSVVYVAQAVTSPHMYNLTSRSIRNFMGLGITQLVIGCLCFIVQIVAAVQQASAWYVMPGIWAGIFFIMAGSFSVSAAKKHTKCPIVTCMVMSIMSSILTVSIITTASIGIAQDSRCYYYSYPYNYCRYVSNKEAKLATHSILLLLSLAEAAVAIASAAVCCGAICCGSRSTQPSQPVHFNNGLGNQQVIILNPGQQILSTQQAFPQQPYQGNAAYFVQPAGTAQAAMPVYSTAPPAYNVYAPPVNQQGVPHLGAVNMAFQAPEPPMAQGGGPQVDNTGLPSKA